jgi:uncharacterized protein (TIGR03437 family)
VETVSVTVGGIPAEVQFSGLQPEFAGRYEVRVVVPQGIAAGNAIPVMVTAAGRSSQTVTMAVK